MDRKRSNRERSERRAAVSRPSTALPLMKPDKKSKALWEAGREEEFHSDNKKNKTTKDELQIKRPTDEQTHMHMHMDTLICFVRVFTVVAPTLMKLPKHIS